VKLPVHHSHNHIHEGYGEELHSHGPLYSHFAKEAPAIKAAPVYEHHEEYHTPEYAPVVSEHDHGSYVTDGGHGHTSYGDSLSHFSPKSYSYGAPSYDHHHDDGGVGSHVEGGYSSGGDGYAYNKK